MPNLNKVIIMGHLGQNPDIRQAGSTKVANFSVASSEKWKDKEGNAHQITEWHKVVLFGKLADISEAYLNKGDGVYIEGKLKTESYTDKDGVERYVTKIIGNNLQMLGGKAKSFNDSKSDNQNSNANNDEFNDDIPF